MEDEFFDLETFQSRADFLAKAYTYQLYFNLVRPNSHKDCLSPWQIIARLASAWPLELCLLPPVFLDYYINDSGGYDPPRLDAFAQASRTQIIKLPARSPNLNACAERRMRTARQEAPYQTGAPRINSGPLRALLVLEKVFELPAMRFADLASVPGGLTKLPTKPRQLVERTP